MPAPLTISCLKKEATFAASESMFDEPSLFGVTDGKAVRSYLEHKFKEPLESRSDFEMGSSAKGIDFPSLGVDIKVTSVKRLWKK